VVSNGAVVYRREAVQQLLLGVEAAREVGAGEQQMQGQRQPGRGAGQL